MTTLTPVAQRFETFFKPTRPGVATCRAENSRGSNFEEAKVFIMDLDKAFLVWGIEFGNVIAADDSVTLACAASKYTFKHVFWYRNNEPLLTSHGKIHIFKIN